MLDRSKTLTELEGDDWGEPDYPSGLVINCHRMRYKPIAELTDGDLRMAIGQQFSLPILVPLALERLADEPLLESDFYEGDLLKLVLLVKPDFWATHPEFWSQTYGIATQGFSAASQLENSWHETIEPDLKATFTTFLERKPATAPAEP